MKNFNQIKIWILKQSKIKILNLTQSVQMEKIIFKIFNKIINKENRRKKMVLIHNWNIIKIKFKFFLIYKD